MISEAVIQALKKYVPDEDICLQESMAGHTTFHIGGPADCLLNLSSEEQLVKVQSYLSFVGIPFFVLGNGSNLLVSDNGYRGVVLNVGKKMSRITVDGCEITAQAGATLSQIAEAAMEHGLAGLEFASGIPGTVGGGIVMNAGAYGGEMSQVVTKVRAVNEDGIVMDLDNETMEFGYRTSVAKKKPLTIIEAVFRLEPGDREQIKAKMDELMEKRREKQPLEYPSAGSTFKRPEGYYAGKLIMDAGLRGYKQGGAMISEKHCGFVINTGNATAWDVCDLIRDVQDRVRDKFGVHLETEVVFIGWGSNNWK